MILVQAKNSKKRVVRQRAEKGNPGVASVRKNVAKKKK